MSIFLLCALVACSSCSLMRSSRDSLARFDEAVSQSRAPCLWKV